MKIQINTLCCQYWRRFFWCLSSLVEQIKPIPDIKLRINTCLEMDKYSHMQRGTDKIFRNLLDIEWVNWKRDDGFNTRENIRNKDIANIGKYIDWMLWLDPDQVMHPMHFNFLFNNLERLEKQKKLLSLIRRDISEKDVSIIFNKFKYRIPVANCFNRFVGFPNKLTRNIPGIGYYQLVSVKLLREKNIDIYSEAKRDRGMWNCVNYVYSTLSDMIFRMKIGAVRMKRIPGIFHLEHPRKLDRVKYFEKDSL